MLRRVDANGVYLSALNARLVSIQFGLFKWSAHHAYYICTSTAMPTTMTSITKQQNRSTRLTADCTEQHSTSRNGVTFVVVVVLATTITLLLLLPLLTTPTIMMMIMMTLTQ